MKTSEVKVGGVYLAKVSDNLVPVRITSMTSKGQYIVLNLKTNRTTTFRTAAKFRRELNPEQVKVYLS